MQIIRKNFGLKVLSLLLAIVGWAYFRYATNPVLAARFEQQFTIPIAAANLTPGLSALLEVKQATVTVASKRGEPDVHPDEIKAMVDLSGKDAGDYVVPVELNAPDVVIQNLSPATVPVTIEKSP